MFVGRPGSLDAYNPTVIAVDGNFILVIVIVAVSATGAILI